MYCQLKGPKILSYFPWKAGFFVIRRYVTPVPHIFQKVIFFRFWQKNIVFFNFFLYFPLIIQKAIY